MDYIQQISNALYKETETIAFLAYFPFNKLEKKLLLVNEQLDVALKNNQTGAAELLKIWQQQLTDAAELKREMQLEDNPSLDMQLSLPEIEAYEMIEKRQQLLKERLLHGKLTESEHKLRNLF